MQMKRSIWRKFIGYLVKTRLTSKLRRINTSKVFKLGNANFHNLKKKKKHFVMIIFLDFDTYLNFASVKPELGEKEIKKLFNHLKVTII